jgi:hypothetical protein
VDEADALQLVAMSVEDPNPIWRWAVFL